MGGDGREVLSGGAGSGDVFGSDDDPLHALEVLKAVVIMTDGEYNSGYCNGVIAQDSTNGSGSREVPLTQERLAAMLGVGRSYISRVIGTFKRDGTLAVRRGHLVVKNEEQLRARACSCHEVVKQHFHTVLKGVYPEP